MFKWRFKAVRVAQDTTADDRGDGTGGQQAGLSGDRSSDRLQQAAVKGTTSGVARSLTEKAWEAFFGD